MNQTLNSNLSFSQSQSFGELLNGLSSEPEHSLRHPSAGESSKIENLQSFQLSTDPHLESLVKDISQILSQRYPSYPNDKYDAGSSDQEKNSSDSLNIREPQSPPKPEFSKEKLDSEIKRFEGLLDQVGLFSENTEKLYNEAKISTIKMIQEKFTELRFLVNAKEGQCIHEINLFYNQEVARLDKQVGKNSLVKQGIAQKISQYRQIIQNGRPSEHLEEDLSIVYQIIQEAVSVESLNKINQKLQEMKQNIDLMLSAQVSALEKMTVMNEELALIQREVDPKLIEKLSSREELKKFNVLFKNSPPQDLVVSPMRNYISIEGGLLKIFYPFVSDFDQNMRAIQAVQENIFGLEFTLSGNLDKICREDLVRLCLIRFNLPRVQEISIELRDFQVSDDALLEIFSCLSWKSNSLKSISCTIGRNYDYDNVLLEKSILFLADTVLSTAKNLKSLSLSFGLGIMTDLAYSSLNQRLPQLAENLTHLDLWCSFYSSQSLNLIGLSNLFVGMPNLLSFTLFLFSHEFNDELLENFISNTMPSLKSLKSFRLIIPYSKITDRSVRKLFKSFPEEWFLNLTELKVNLGDTSVTNKGIKEFVGETLRKFEALEDFKLVTSEPSCVKKLICEWGKILSKEA